MIRPKIGLDWDDVTAPFNDIAIEMANARYNIIPPLTLEDIDSWENKGRASVIKEFYNEEELYRRQKVSEETRNQVLKLMEIADVYFVTAAYPQFMGIRAKQILEAFPGFPPENIILGNAKNLVQLDIVLDDAIHNVLESPAAYPVLMRKPWNWKMTGMLSVNNMTEFVLLVEQIISASLYKEKKIRIPSVLALVGPSGSGKNDIVQELCQETAYASPKTYCTKHSDKHKYLTDEEFAKQNFFETTMYAGIKYGTKQEDIDQVLKNGQFAVMPLDMCGAIAMKRHFPTAIIYVSKDKEQLIKEIIDDDYDTSEKTLRILSIDAEKRNKQICDYIIDNSSNDGAAILRDLIYGR